jgi:hypothetical protein
LSLELPDKTEMANENNIKQAKKLVRMLSLELCALGLVEKGNSWDMAGEYTRRMQPFCGDPGTKYAEHDFLDEVTKEVTGARSATPEIKPANNKSHVNQKRLNDDMTNRVWGNPRDKRPRGGPNNRDHKGPQSG